MSLSYPTAEDRLSSMAPPASVPPLVPPAPQRPIPQEPRPPGRPEGNPSSVAPGVPPHPVRSNPKTPSTFPRSLSAIVSNPLSSSSPDPPIPPRNPGQSPVQRTQRPER